MANTRPARAQATTIGTNKDCSISAAHDSALVNILSSIIGEISFMPYWILTSVRDNLELIVRIPKMIKMKSYVEVWLLFPVNVVLKPVMQE